MTAGGSPPKSPAHSPRIFIVLPVFEPDADTFALQVRSIAGQTRAPFRILFVNADLASADLIETTARAADLSFSLHTPTRKLDATQAFEFGLKAVLKLSDPGDLVALSDQDDIWLPDRLAVGADRLASTGAGLVHGDAEVIDETGARIDASLFAREGRPKSAGLRDMLYRNNVTGMTALMTRAVVSSALPFPRQAGRFFYHDLWLAMVAEVLGGVVFIDRPLVQYRQHGRNVIGALSGASHLPRFATMPWLRAMAGSYFVSSYLAKSLYIRMRHRVEKEGAVVERARLKVLAPFLSIRGAGLRFFWDAARLAIRGHRTMAHYALAFFVVRVGRLVWALRQTGRPRLMPQLVRFDERGYSMAPGVQPEEMPQAPTPVAVPRTEAEFADPRMSARWEVEIDDRAPRRFNVLVPTVNPTEVFAGIATAIDIGLGLAGRGHPVRFIATDLPIASREAARAFVLGRIASQVRRSDLARAVEVVCSHSEARLTFSPRDRFLATAWWTAHLADEVVAKGGFDDRRFFYLIQDYEPNFYPWGDESARATASYDLEFEPIFNTTLLRDFFQLRGYEFATAQSLSFQPSIDISTYLTQERQPQSPRRLVLYGRPEVPRNLFGTAIQSIAAFLDKEGLKPGEIELLSVGLPHEPIDFPGGHRMISRGKLPWADYPRFLATVDVGVSLMLSPHPSHPPIEMAAAGARVVTNRFGVKDLSILSPSISSSAPNFRDLSQAIAEAWNAPAPGQADRRIDLDRIGRPLPEVVRSVADLIGSPEDTARPRSKAVSSRV